jgi:hypothetical protein
MPTNSRLTLTLFEIVPSPNSGELSAHRHRVLLIDHSIISQLQVGQRFQFDVDKVDERATCELTTSRWAGNEDLDSKSQDIGLNSFVDVHVGNASYGVHQGGHAEIEKTADGFKFIGGDAGTQPILDPHMHLLEMERIRKRRSSARQAYEEEVDPREPHEDSDGHDFSPIPSDSE